VSIRVTASTTPREIVAALHKQIAAKSPAHAALVAAYEAAPQRPVRPVRQPRRPAAAGSVRYRRLSIYAASRLGGASVKTAARKAGISRESGQQYEADFLGVIGGAI